MLNDAELRELLEINVPESVLSVYLNTEPSKGNTETYKLRLRNMLKTVNLRQDVEAIERYVDHEYDWNGRGLVMFSCVGKAFFQTFPLAIPVRDFAYVGNQPSIKPLANLLENYGGYGVVLVDKQGARLFSFHLGHLNEQEGVMGETIKRTKRGGASSVHGQRGGVAGKTNAMDETVDRNMKDMAEFASRFFEENRVRRILISGSDDNVSLFRSLLPKAWQSLVVGTFPMSMTATHAEVLVRALEIGDHAEREREKRSLDTLLTAASKKKNEAVMGLENTLLAINNGRVRTLILIEDKHQSGFHCPDCNILTTNPVEHCSDCGGKITPLPDVIEIAVSAVISHGGDVELLSTTPEFEEKGGIGALLRF